MKRLKKASFEDFAKSINTKSAPQELWSKVRRLTNHHTQTSIYAMKTAQATITEPKAIAHLFAHNWSECSNDSNFPNQFKLAKNSPITPNQVTNTTAKKMENNISMEEMLFTLKLTKGKTPGLDRISYSMIKHLDISAKGRLLALYNNIFQSGTIPQNWKSATIIPILKPRKDPSLLESYRPISLITCLSKLVEKIVAARLLWFTESKMLISSNQVGFRPGRGCTDALLHIDYHVAKSLSTHNHISILSIDFEKAFDRIGAHVILEKLRQWGVGPKIFKFVKSFLINRKIRVKVNGTHSNLHPLTNGIPQGSPLSVLLFSIAFNEISNIILKHKLVDHCAYADDVFLLCKAKDINESN